MEMKELLGYTYIFDIGPAGLLVGGGYDKPLDPEVCITKILDLHHVKVAAYSQWSPLYCLGLRTHYDGLLFSANPKWLAWGNVERGGYCCVAKTESLVGANGGNIFSSQSSDWGWANG